MKDILAVLHMYIGCIRGEPKFSLLCGGVILQNPGLSCEPTVTNNLKNKPLNIA